MSSLSSVDWFDGETIAFGPESGNVQGITLNSSGRYLAVYFSREVQIWDLWNLEESQPAPLARYSASSSAEITCIKWVGEETLATGHIDGRVYVVGINKLQASGTSGRGKVMKWYMNMAKWCITMVAGRLLLNNETSTKSIEMRGLKAKNISEKVGSVAIWTVEGTRLLLAAIGRHIRVWRVEHAALEHPWTDLGDLPDPPDIGGIGVKSLPISQIFVGKKVVVCYSEIGIVFVDHFDL
ncbi:hypothetical protein V5O48_006555 [Marasmius crinis-equi]|uniref:Uncharacterized protein n=1 Tax=Marasmius crinis-equi TaxID=585013 RepID=A0ABR3FK24_9AGAR